MTLSDLVLRPATEEDLPAVAECYLTARGRAEALGSMPVGVHRAEEVRSWVRSWDLSGREVWLAEAGGAVVGFADATASWLDNLYVAPAAQRCGVGSALLDVVKARRPGGFSLWVFETNRPARAFYARHGLVELERTDGSANEERAPDITMAWRGSTGRSPVAG